MSSTGSGRVARTDADRFAQARRLMVERDVRARGVTDEAVLAAMVEVPREAFVEAELAWAAYDDHPLPIGHGQTISQPFIVAAMAEALQLRPTDRVLEVGSGSGYAAAVLSRLAAHVVGIERFAELVEVARPRLARLGYDNVELHAGDGTAGWPPAAPYDAILVSAGGALLPEPLVDQLAVGGRIVIPLGPTEGSQQLYRLRRLAPGRWQRDDLGSVRFVPLVGRRAWPDPRPAR